MPRTVRVYDEYAFGFSWVLEEGMQRSSHALVEVLQRNWRSADLNANGVIEVSELYRALRSMVASETQGNQTPWLARQDLIGDFALF